MTARSPHGDLRRAYKEAEMEDEIRRMVRTTDGARVRVAVNAISAATSGRAELIFSDVGTATVEFKRPTGTAGWQLDASWVTWNGEEKVGFAQRISDNMHHALGGLTPAGYGSLVEGDSGH